MEVERCVVGLNDGIGIRHLRTEYVHIILFLSVRISLISHCDGIATDK